MDGLLSKGKEMMSNMGSSNNQGGAPQGGDLNAQQAGNTGAGQEDYGDKGESLHLDAILYHHTNPIVQHSTSSRRRQAIPFPATKTRRSPTVQETSTRRRLGMSPLPFLSPYLLILQSPPSNDKRESRAPLKHSPNATQLH